MSVINRKWYLQPWFVALVFLGVVLPLAYFCGFGTEKM